ncbi:MAG TPA: hypothetical protein VM925_28360 [Labilithrix sp.]|jgi:hypothetical protein|nr:hypothetical protein [Labilithrix sp.]
MKRSSILLAMALTASSAGCTIKTVDKPVTVTTKQLPEASKPEIVKAAKEVTGQSCNRVVLLFIPVGFATAESAYAEALGQAPGTDMLLNYEARANVLFITPFYYQVCTQVHGLAVNSKTFVAAAENPSAARAELDAWRRKWDDEKATVVARAQASR